jgi:glycosyltransferase involved in cell wall biosynthesis
MKTIAFLVPKVHNEGGVARVSSIVTDALYGSQNKYRIIIIGYTSGSKDGYSWNKELKYYTIFSQSTPLSKGVRTGTKVLRKIIAKESVDLLVSCDSNLSFLGFTATRFNKTKLLYWDHTNFFENKSHKFKKQSKKVMALFADAIVVLTKTDQDNWKKNTRAKAIDQIYNPVQLVQNAKSYDVDSTKIISVGRLTDQKNFRIIPIIARKLLDMGVVFEWHIYGDGEQHGLIKKEIEKQGVSDFVYFMGHQDMNGEIYSRYGLMAMTSNYEGFPMVLLEGLSNGLPLISFDIQTGPNEIITEGVNGYLIKAFDSNEYAKKIEILFNSSELRLKISRATTLKMEEFKQEKITNEWLALFDKLL